MIWRRSTTTSLHGNSLVRPISAWLVAFAVMIISHAARAQTLDFTGAPQAPTLTQFSYTWELRQQLEMEIAERIAAEHPDTPVQNLVLRATVAYRLVASNLLETAHQNQSRGSVAFLYGVTIADGRQSLDAALQQLVDLHAGLAQLPEDESPEMRARYARISRMVRLFNEQVTHKAALLRTVDITELDNHLPVVFSPLASAITNLHGGEMPSYWPPAMTLHVSDTRAPSGRPASANRVDVPTVESLYKRSQSLDLPPGASENITTILAFLQRGREFAELTPTVARYAQVMARVLETAESLEEATWLRDDARSIVQARIIRALEQFADPAQREPAIASIGHLHQLAQVLHRVNTLIEVGAHRRHVVRPIVDAIVNMLSDSAATDDSLDRRMRSLAVLLDRMITYRDLKERKLRQELRAVQVRLQRLYEDAEVALVKQIPTLISDRDALADPALSSHISQQRQYLTDLRRIAHIPGWVDALAIIAPDAADPFLNQSRKMAAWLLDTTRRPDATQAMEQFEQQLAMFNPMPFENTLRTDEATAAIVTGGMHQQLLDAIDDTRKHWAMAWADGDAGSDAANEMLMLHRLMYVLASTAEIQQLDGDLSLLNRWSAWQLNSVTIARAFADLPGRLQLAIAAITRDDRNDLRLQLERIDRDAPLAKLTGQLTLILAEDLLTRPGNPLATLGQIMHPPDEHAWLFDRRTQLARLCWNALEQEYANATDQRDNLNMLRDCVAFHVDELLALLGERRDPLPVVSGFDGSDPNPDVPEIRMRNN